MEIDNKPRTNPTVDEHLNSEASLGSDHEKKADAASGSQMEISTNKVSQLDVSAKSQNLIAIQVENNVICFLVFAH